MTGSGSPQKLFLTESLASRSRLPGVTSAVGCAQRALPNGPPRIHGGKSVKSRPAGGTNVGEATNLARFAVAGYRRRMRFGYNAAICNPIGGRPQGPPARNNLRETLMANASHTIRQELYGILLFVGSIWAVFLLTCVFQSLDGFGIVPRTVVGLIGIPLCPFLHYNLHHLLANTVPLLVLLALLAGSQARSWEIVVEVVLLGGLLLWLFGPKVDTIGASGLIFGLITFMIVSGILERRIVPLLVTVVVGFMYGGTLLWGILPHGDPLVSWQGHLCGAIAGAGVACALARKPAKDQQRANEGEHSV